MPTIEADVIMTEPVAGVICAACSHRWDAHDAIGLRFCSATVDQRLGRGCVCVGGAANEPRTSSAG